MPRIIWTCLIAALTGNLSAQEQPPSGNPDQQVATDRPSFLVRAEVNHKTRTYRNGDFLSVRIASERAGYAYLLYETADGNVFQLYPNVLQTDNRIAARETIQVPHPDDQFRLQIAPPFGTEKVRVIVSEQPITPLSHPSMRKANVNPVSAKLLKGIELELGEEQHAPWGEHVVEIVTYEKSPAADDKSRRWGVFFGVSQYQFNTEAEQSGSHLNLKVCHRDAGRFAELMKENGQLNDLKLYTNETATRANLQAAITRWLPSRSRPGDTVFIYFSGHGSKVSDQQSTGDEADGKDEVLVPHDYIDAGILNALLKQKELPVTVIKRLRRILPKIKNGKTLREKNSILIRETGVSDDLFAKWLQHLDGRKVVVILDVCFSGGFVANEEKGNAKQPAAFDFLDTEISRLKDLGQRDAVMLASSRSGQTSLEAVLGNELSVMTNYLVESLQRSPGTLTVDHAYTHCENRMLTLFKSPAFEQLNRARESAGRKPYVPHQPVISPKQIPLGLYLKP